MKFLQHPLVHFLTGGAVIFGIYGWSASNEALVQEAPPTVHIGAGEVAWLQETFMRQRQRPATRDEMIGLVTTYLQEELLAREARTLGLERDDTLVRRRLAQKLSFMLQDTFRFAEPPDEELRQYFEANAARYTSGSRATFGHVFFDPEKRADAESDARAALRTITAKHELPPTEEIGDRLLIESPVVGADHAAIAAQFGDEFAGAVLALPEKTWQGPIHSAYGWHLVFLNEKTGTTPAQFDDVHARVREDWYQERQRIEIARYFARLMEKYRVETDPDVRGMIGPLDTLLPQGIGDSGEPQ